MARKGLRRWATATWIAGMMILLAGFVVLVWTIVHHIDVNTVLLKSSVLTVSVFSLGMLIWATAIFLIFLSLVLVAKSRSG